MIDTAGLRAVIEETSGYAGAIDSPQTVAAVEETIDLMDRGELRLAEKIDGEWTVNAWLQKAIVLYFRITQMETPAHW